MADATKQLRILVHGRVQGVGFRYFVVDTARQLALTGWARNLPDGTVEVLAQGPEEALRALLAAVGEGPSAARVQGVDSSWEEAGGDLPAFTIRR